MKVLKLMFGQDLGAEVWLMFAVIIWFKTFEIKILKLCKDTRNCPEKAMKISHFNPNQSAPSIYIMIELCYFSLDQWEIRIHLLWGKSFNIPLHCDPHLNQTKWLIFNELLPLTIPGVLVALPALNHSSLFRVRSTTNFDARNVDLICPRSCLLFLVFVQFERDSINNPSISL